MPEGPGGRSGPVGLGDRTGADPRALADPLRPAYHGTAPAGWMDDANGGVSPREHCVWREQGRWRRLTGSGIRHRGGTAYLFESEDLLIWNLISPLVVGDASALPDTDPLWTGTMWECVDFFRLGPDGSTAPPDRSSVDPHVLIFSAGDEGRALYPLAATGRYVRDRFEIDGYQRLDLGGRHASAPQTSVDEQGRRILCSGMREGRSARAQWEAGWSGAMALPRVLRRDEDGVIRQAPMPELAAARGAALAWTTDGEVHRAQGTQVEIAFDAVVPCGAAITVELFATPDGEERTTVRLSRAAVGVLRLELDRARSSRDLDPDGSAHVGTIPGSAPDAEVQFRAFLDRSSIELFVDGIALTTRVYPVRADARLIRIAGEGASLVGDPVGWEMRSGADTTYRSHSKSSRFELDMSCNRSYS